LDLVIHGAAATGFNLGERVYREVNIGGTANVLALIGQRGQAPIPLLHLSTSYVCGERSGPVAEGELDVGQRFANGYESSKAEAERLVRAAQQIAMNEAKSYAGVINRQAPVQSDVP
jgi:2-alkyl-3-oxoalkanoate reductase